MNHKMILLAMMAIFLISFTNLTLAQNTNIANEYTSGTENAVYITSVHFNSITYDVYGISNVLNGNSNYLVLKQDGTRETGPNNIVKAVFYAGTTQFLREKGPNLATIFPSIETDINSAKENDPSIVNILITSITDRIKEISINLCVPGYSFICASTSVDITINNWDTLDTNVLSLQSLTTNLQGNQILGDQVEKFYKLTISLQDALGNSNNPKLVSDSSTLKSFNIDGKKDSLEKLAYQEPQKIESRVSLKKSELSQTIRNATDNLNSLKWKIFDCIWNNCVDASSFEVRYGTIKSKLVTTNNENFNSQIKSIQNVGIDQLNIEIKNDQRQSFSINGPINAIGWILTHLI